MIRAAKFTDIPAIIQLGHHALSESRYAGAKIDEAKAKAIIFDAIAGHGAPKAYASLVLIAEEADGIVGIIMGVIRPVYEVLDINQVSHLIWYVRAGASARTGIRLMRGLHKWADSDGPMAKVHIVGNTIIDPKLTGRLLKMEGFEQAGSLFYKE